ncbi:30S ribosomal protein S12 methylthiotransferase RimO [Alkalibaculum sp. M08DMB]|uniref:Ribosomal protein uS12 methylthiotransferase RimO n=1 Tax=Alkalibaculum sporogenes TaxID=2655001 RepID=A0A6A7K9F0_9FIRM|nr:30S ribosomal protein S12 methylthiotransferase RimO [Alkalibaculum sporogenes]MPW25817.1 30S ribosomal protein S12 methylthiotransferase RimO [Alkalibaculum sporogenes]
MTCNVGLVSLGCAKNLVDSEIMLGLIEEGNYVLVEDNSKAEVLIVNTCGFIASAKDESIDTILELAQNKVHGSLKVLIATGCLSERYKEDLLNSIPELDAVVGTGDYVNIVKIIEDTLNGEKVCAYGNIHYNFDESLPRKISTPKYTAFVKIGDGCNNHCTFCIIPTLRGRFRSRKPKDIKQEIINLVSNGVKEVILIAQDITQYGIDIYGKNSLPLLLKELEDIDMLKWIRLLYAYPENISDELIDVIKNSTKIINYLDIPLQHTEDNVLKGMARKTNKVKITKLIEKLRSEIPDIVIRSSFITGFPGESDEDFNNMLKTLEDLKLDRLGVFTYSLEEDTKAALFENQVPDEIKIDRQEKILQMQQEISLMNNEKKINHVLEILIEGVTDDPSVYFGRSYMDTPEIDGIVYVHSNYKLEEGQMCKTLITDALEYDLIGEITGEFTK